MAEIKKALENEVLTELEGLTQCEIGKEDYKNTVNGVCQLIDKINEIQKLEIEADDKIHSRKSAEESAKEDMNLKMVTFIEERKDKKVKNWLTAAGIGIPMLGFIWANVYNWKKETGGTMTFSGGRAAVSNLLNSLKIR